MTYFKNTKNEREREGGREGGKEVGREVGREGESVCVWVHQKVGLCNIGTEKEKHSLMTYKYIH